jgi:hypothetical protein
MVSSALPLARFHVRRAVWGHLSLFSFPAPRAAWMGACNLASRQDADHAVRVARFAAGAIRAGPDLLCIPPALAPF